MEHHEPGRLEPESSVATKIILLVFLSTFVSAAAVSWISIETARRQLWTQIRESYPALAERSGQRLLRWLVEGRSVTADLARQARTRDSLRALLADAAAPGASAGATPLFRRLVAPVTARSREIHGFALLGPDGHGSLETEGFPPLSKEVRKRLTQPSPPLVQIAPGGAGNPILLTSVPVHGPGEAPAAWLVGLYRRDTLRDALATDRPDATTRVSVLDAAGAVIVHAGLPSETGAALAPSRIPAGEVGEYNDAAGQHVIGVAHPLGTLGFTVAVEAPYDRAFAPMLAVLRRLLLIDVCVVALASLLAYAITASIVRPIEALSEGARRIAGGGVVEPLPETGRRDELGLLTRTFNEMLRRLQRSQAALEEANRGLRDHNETLLASNEILEQLSITDGLTKLHYPRFFQDHLSREIKRVRRTGEPLSMILLDIDDFKRLNDRLGHAAGDEVLQKLAVVLSESVRASDLVARYGGEEFAVVASATDLQGAVILAEKIRAAVSAAPFAIDDSPRGVPVTVSVGVAEFKGDRKKFFQAADQALYRAKAEGKDCVRIAEAPAGA